MAQSVPKYVVISFTKHYAASELVICAAIGHDDSFDTRKFYERQNVEDLCDLKKNFFFR